MATRYKKITRNKNTVVYYNNCEKVAALPNDNCKTAQELRTKKERSNKNSENNNNNKQPKQKIKISKNKLKFFINLYIKLILCISELNKSMLQIINYKNYQKCIDIKLLEKAKLKTCKISFETTKKLLRTTINFLKSCYRTIENVQIRQILPIVRHFIGICLIRLISLKRLQQIPTTHFIPRKDNKQKYQIVGNAQFGREYEKWRKKSESNRELSSNYNYREGEETNELRNFYKINSFKNEEYKRAGNTQILNNEIMENQYLRDIIGAAINEETEKRQKHKEMFLKRKESCRLNEKWISSQCLKEIFRSALKEKMNQSTTFNCHQISKRHYKIEKSRERRKYLRKMGNALNSQYLRVFIRAAINKESKQPKSLDFKQIQKRQKLREKLRKRKDSIRQIGYMRNFQCMIEIFRSAIHEETKQYSCIHFYNTQERQHQIDTSIEEREYFKINGNSNSSYLRNLVRSDLNEEIFKTTTNEETKLFSCFHLNQTQERQDQIETSIEGREYFKIYGNSISSYLRNIIRSALNEESKQPTPFDFKPVQKKEYSGEIGNSINPKYVRQIFKSAINEESKQSSCFYFNPIQEGQHQIETSIENKENLRIIGDSKNSQHWRDFIRTALNPESKQSTSLDFHQLLQRQNQREKYIENREHCRVIWINSLYIREIFRKQFSLIYFNQIQETLKQIESIEERKYLKINGNSRNIIRFSLNEQSRLSKSLDLHQNQLEKSLEKRELCRVISNSLISQYLNNIFTESYQKNGHSTSYQYLKVAASNKHPYKGFITHLAHNYFNHVKPTSYKVFEIIANLQQYQQHFNDFNVKLTEPQYRHHCSSSELLLRRYHKDEKEKEHHRYYHYYYYHSSLNNDNNIYQNSRQRQNHHFEQQQKCRERECHHFLFYSLLCSGGSCWHICGFPLVSQDIFKYLNELTVRMLATWLQTLPAATMMISERKLKNLTTTTTATKVKATIIANQKDFVKIPTKTTTYSSSSSFSSSTSLKAAATSSQKTPCFQQHYQHQQRQHHHSQQQQHPQFHPTPTASFRKLPSWLLLSRTLIILILLSSLWHTSEGFHGTGIKLSPNTVKTKYGLVRGIVVRSSPSLVEAYLGIPYASPPVGSLRFMPPITPSTWKTVRNADRFSPVCPQTVPIPPNGPEALLEVPRARLAQLRRLLPLLSNQSEDCLYLNIYVPYENRRHRRFTTNSGEQNDTPKLPTILFIHGESYEWNSGNPYDGSELAAHGNVIVVTINFRLGIFGFLKTGGKESAQGNFGLMDLVAGLHWLKENLPAFGGDPQAITLLGHGTGAALANILMVSPVASDLIQHCVLVSGSALSPWAIQKNPLFVKRRVAEQTGCHGDMLYDDLAPCLRTKTVAELLTVKIDHPRFLVGFAPFIDGTVISPNTDSIGKLSLPLGSAIVSTSGIEFANFPKRNLIFCLTSVESHLDLSAQDLEFGFNETRRDRILRTYVRNNFHYHLNEIFAVLKNEYTDWDKAIRSPLSARDATLQFLSDGHTASSLIKLGYMHGLRGGRGYFLHFKHRTVEEEYPQRTGSVRGEDVPFWLGLPISPLFPHNYTAQEKQISRLMLKYLANFAKTGNPNQATSSPVLPSSSSLIALPSSSSSSSTTSSHAADDHRQVKRSSSVSIVNNTSSISGPTKSNGLVVDVETAATREALNLAVLYNQRRTKRTYYKRHSRSNDDHNGGSSGSSEIDYFPNANSKLDGDEMPFWDAYDVVNQLYMELGNKAQIQSHYRGHKLSMWLNLIPQLHRHANMNDQSMRHHQFQDDLNNLNLYEGIVRAQIQTKPADDDETLLLPKARPTPPPPVVAETNTTQKPSGITTECGVDGAMFVAEMTNAPPSDNHSLVLDSREKEMATASTGLIGNLEVLRRLSGKQFQSYTTALVATVAVGCFLLILNILIFAGIYHQREKRARDAKTKEELQDNDTSKNSSMLKLNAMGSESGSFNGSGAGVSGKTTVVFGEYSCYDEKSLHTKDEKLMVELPPSQILDPSWAACSTSTLDLLKTKHHHQTLEASSYPLSKVVPITTEQKPEHLMPVNAMEMATYNPLPMSSGLIIDPTITAHSSGLQSKRGSFVGSSSHLNQYDFASVQSSDQMSFKDIENAVKLSVSRDNEMTQDDDIPEPPPPPRSFQSMKHQQAQQSLQQQTQQVTTNPSASGSGTGTGVGGGILRQAGTSSSTQTGGGKKRVHIQEISV